MKPLNALAGDGVKPCRSGMITTLSATSNGSTDPSAHAAQCLQSCCADGLPGCSCSWQPAIIASALAIGSTAAGCGNMQPSIDADANVCSGRASISKISRNRWRFVRTQPV